MLERAASAHALFARQLGFMLYQRQHRIAKGSSDLACVDTLYKSAPAPHLRELGSFYIVNPWIFT
jgi:hypothetical protein